MGDKNLVILVGTLVNTPTVKTGKDGKQYSVFHLLTKFRRGEREWTQNHAMQTWTPDILKNYAKGDRVRIEGWLNYHVLKNQPGPYQIKIAYINITAMEPEGVENG